MNLKVVTLLVSSPLVLWGLIDSKVLKFLTSVEDGNDSSAVIGEAFTKT